MRRTVYVISDLHLGGAPPSGDSPGFQICSAPGQTLLADFLRWVAGQRTADRDIHLVVNGDCVDFLAEQPFQEFTSDEKEAERKLALIIERTEPVWEQFRAVVTAGAEVTVLLGNHDLELTLPRPRALLRRTLGPGRVELQLDNTALQIGSDILIEHGNRYDEWNSAKHDALRRIRSAISRREKPEKFTGPPGSRMVIQVMNELKQEFRFIDLLKPEQEGVIPLLVALKPAVLKKLNSIRAYKKKAKAVPYSDEGTPLDPEMISAQRRERASQQKALEFARAGGLDPEEISTWGAAKGLLERWRAHSGEEKREAEVNIAYEALQEWLGVHFTAFDTRQETPEYLRAAKTSVRNGFSTVIYGHTHLAKRLSPLGAGDLYLNTGTWADLMAVPKAILLDDEPNARRQLRGFLDDLAANRLENWKNPLPTFARLEMDGEHAVDRDMFVYQGDGQKSRMTEGRLELRPATDGTGER